MVSARVRFGKQREYKDALADLEKVIIMDMEYPETVRLWADVLAWPVAKKERRQLTTLRVFIL